MTLECRSNETAERSLRDLRSKWQHRRQRLRSAADTFNLPTRVCAKKPTACTSSVIPSDCIAAQRRAPKYRQMQTYVHRGMDNGYMRLIRDSKIGLSKRGFGLLLD